MRLGDTAVEYSKEFRFYMTTKLPNPTYTPELATEVSLSTHGKVIDSLKSNLRVLGLIVGDAAQFHDYARGFARPAAVHDCGG